MLDDLERNVDRTDSKLSDAMRRMKKFIRQTEGKSSVHDIRQSLTTLQRRSPAGA